MKAIRHYFIIEYREIVERWVISSALSPNKKSIKATLAYLQSVSPTTKYSIGSAVLEDSSNADR